MSDHLAIETKDLCYSFADGSFAVDNVNLHVPAGSIYGFLGPNGAGKTTTMRLLCGMLPAKGDNVYLLGRRLDQSIPEVFRDVGTLIETPSIYLNLTAYDNLRVICQLRGLDISLIMPVLDMVGLGDTGKKKAKAFSLGMKQRLGIAFALLHKPRLMLLDEPVNGLDPGGIVEMRELLIRLRNEYGITIFISSHLLSEIEKTCDHVGIIHKGKMRYQGTMRDLLESEAMSREVQFHIHDARSLLSRVQEAFPNAKVVKGDRIQINLDDEAKVSDVNRALVEMGIPVEGIDVRKGLEDWFMSITNEKTEKHAVA